jgi:hypothetical protein
MSKTKNSQLLVKQKIDAASYSNVFHLLLGQSSNDNDAQVQKLINKASHHNRWFTKEEIERRLQAILMCVDSGNFGIIYSHITPSKQQQTIALISEENIPLEEFFTIITILATGHKVLYKTSEKQDKILPYLFSLLETGDKLTLRRFYQKL